MLEIAQELRQFVLDSFLFGQSSIELKDDDSFLEKGIIDSTGVLELVAFLEDKYQIKIEDEEVIPKNLDSINNLLRFLENKLQISLQGRGNNHAS